MICPKCGAETPAELKLCLQCGEPLQPQPAPISEAPTGTDKSARYGLPFMPVIGSAALLVGPFLRWVNRDIPADRYTMQGLYWPPGSVIFVTGLIVFLVLIILKDRERDLTVALTVIGAVSLALVFHFVYVVYDEPGLAWKNVSAGFYLSAAGAVLTALSGCPLFRKLKF